MEGVDLNVHLVVNGSPVRGFAHPDFTGTKEAFVALYAGDCEEQEVGSSVAITVGGELVVHLWGGFQDTARTRPWEERTFVNMMSVAKGVSAMCVHVLVDRGVIDLESPVVEYWPEFAANGKEGILVRHILDHTAGLFAADEAKPGDIFDHGAMAAALARQVPEWPPGVRSGYHMLTQGFLLNELIRRTDGRSLGTFLRGELAEPLQAEYYIGLHAEELGRCADFIPALGEASLFDVGAHETGQLMQRAWSGSPEDPEYRYYNGEEWRTAEIPSANGHGTTRGVATLYGALANRGELGGVRVISPAAIERAAREQHHLPEEVLGRRYHQALGFLLDSPPIVTYGAARRAFGHHGVGGSLGFCDPDARASFAYAPNRLHARLDNGPRSRKLIDAMYRDLRAR